MESSSYTPGAEGVLAFAGVFFTAAGFAGADLAVEGAFAADADLAEAVVFAEVAVTFAVAVAFAEDEVFEAVTVLAVDLVAVFAAGFTADFAVADLVAGAAAFADVAFAGAVFDTAVLAAVAFAGAVFVAVDFFAGAALADFLAAASSAACIAAIRADKPVFFSDILIPPKNVDF